MWHTILKHDVIFWTGGEKTHNWQVVQGSKCPDSVGDVLRRESLQLCLAVLSQVAQHRFGWAVAQGSYCPQSISLQSVRLFTGGWYALCLLWATSQTKESDYCLVFGSGLSLASHLHLVWQLMPCRQQSHKDRTAYTKSYSKA